VRNEVFYRITQKRNILRTIKRRKASWIGHILCRNCFLKHIIEGNIKERMKVMGRGGGGRKQLLDDLKEKREYWKLKEEALAHSVENWHWKRLWICHKTENKIYEQCEDLKLNRVCLRI
jgi:hypothetical protein